MSPTSYQTAPPREVIVSQDVAADLLSSNCPQLPSFVNTCEQNLWAFPPGTVQVCRGVGFGKISVPLLYAAR
jgi:hypothetical protein